MRRAQPVGRDDAPLGPARAVPRRRPERVADLRAGGQGRRVLDAQRQAGAAAQADAAAVSQSRQLRRVGGRAVALAGHAGGGGRRLHPHRDRGRPAAGAGRRRARRALRRQGARQGRPGAGELRARVGRRGQGHRAGRGHLGAPHRRGDPGVRPGRRPRAAGVGAGRQGGVGGRPTSWTACVHTLGWPLRYGARYHEFGGSWIYPMGDDRVSIGFVVGLDYADATVSVHDLLQQFKHVQAGARDPRGRQAGRMGRQGDPRGRLLGDAQALRARPGAVRRQRRDGQRADPQGHPLRDPLGHPRRGGDLRGAQERLQPTCPATTRRWTSR